MNEEFLQAIIDAIDTRMEIKFPELQKKYTNWATGEVVTGGSGTMIPVYINNSTTAVTIRNPNGLSLTAGKLVAVISPNYKDDNMRYIDRIL